MPKLLLIFFFMLCAPHGMGQKDSTTVRYDTTSLKVRQITTSDLQKYYGNEAFDYEIVKAERTWWDNFKTWLGNGLLRIFEWIFGVGKAAGFLAAFLRILPYLLLGLLMYLLIKFFLSVNARSLRAAQKSQDFVSLSEEENIIKNEDIQELIRKALDVADYRLAIRYYYLYILKLMTEKELIVWELQKTNNDYLKEIKKTELERPFTKITRLYEYIWYGDFPIDKVRYQKAEPEFLHLQKMVSGHG